VSVVELELDAQRGGEALKATLDVNSEAYRLNFDASDLMRDDQMAVPVLGLFQNAENRITFRLGDGDAWATGEATIRVGTVYSELVTVHHAKPSAMEPGFTFVAGPDGSTSRVYDERGELRWAGPTIMRIAEDGNLLVGMSKLNWLGKTGKEWTLPDTLTFHHDSLELEGGHLLACVDNSETTIENAQGNEVASTHDYVVELDEDSKIVDAWDLREFLDVDRQTISNRGADWAHVNSIAYNAENQVLYVSSRYQGLLKLSGRSARARCRSLASPSNGSWHRTWAGVSPVAMAAVPSTPTIIY
jgi:hypothetical protein